MKTNYHNMSVFDAAAACMIAVGIALIGLQFYLAAPDKVQDRIISSLDILDMNETWQIQQEVSGFVFGGMSDFYREFHVAFMQVMPTEVWQGTGEMMADLYRDGQSAYHFIANEYAPYLASNYNTNSFAATGVESSMGGKVLGEYFEMFGE